MELSVWPLGKAKDAGSGARTLSTADGPCPGWPSDDRQGHGPGGRHGDERSRPDATGAPGEHGNDAKARMVMRQGVPHDREEPGGVRRCRIPVDTIHSRTGMSQAFGHPARRAPKPRCGAPRQKAPARWRGKRPGSNRHACGSLPRRRGELMQASLTFVPAAWSEVGSAACTELAAGMREDGGMTIRVLAIGKKHESWVSEGIERYEKRMKKPFDIKWQLLPHSLAGGRCGPHRGIRADPGKGRCPGFPGAARRAREEHRLPRPWPRPCSAPSTPRGTSPW